MEIVEGAAIGLGAGVSFYLATAVFMRLAARWPPLARHARALYGDRGTLGLPSELALSALLIAPAEELLWRGVVLQTLILRFGPSPLVPAAAWLLYVGANAFSGSLPILLAAIVGGAVWTALAVWTGGVAASVVCHAVWTSLMIIRPPIRSGV